MSLSIFIWAHLDQRARDLLRETLVNHQVHMGNPRQPTEADRRALAGAEIAFGNVPAAWLQAAPRLRWMQLESIGFEYYQHLQGNLGNLAISNLKGMFDRPAAETALAGLLALSRGLPRLLPAQVEARWIELEVRPETYLIHGRSVLILGLGSIGRKMQKLLEAFDCHVTTFAKSSPDANLHSLDELKEAFPKADIVVCCLPKTPETIGLISRDLLNRLSPRAVFVNIGRGAVLDEVALIESLNSRRLGGAVIDVTHAEPLPREHPFWRCPNTILTQHTGGGYADELVDKARAFLGNLDRYRRGEPLKNLIDLTKGY